MRDPAMRVTLDPAMRDPAMDPDRAMPAQCPMGWQGTRVGYRREMMTTFVCWDVFTGGDAESARDDWVRRT